jgi:hypothetical protein
MESMSEAMHANDIINNGILCKTVSSDRELPIAMAPIVSICVL